MTLAEFSKWPYIGGKSGVGHGKVAVRFDKWMEINPRTAPSGKEIDFALGTHYLQHLQEHRDKIKEMLDGLQ